MTNFFDVTLKPGQGQELTIEVKNKAEEDLTIVPALENTVSNDNGIIDYVHRDDIKYDKTLKYKFVDISSTEKKVRIPAKSTKTFVTTLKMPKEKFNGIILGGIRVIEDYGDEKDSKIFNY